MQVEKVRGHKHKKDKKEKKEKKEHKKDRKHDKERHDSRKRSRSRSLSPPRTQAPAYRTLQRPDSRDGRQALGSDREHAGLRGADKEGSHRHHHRSRSRSRSRDRYDRHGSQQRPQHGAAHPSSRQQGRTSREEDRAGHRGPCREDGRGQADHGHHHSHHSGGEQHSSKHHHQQHHGSSAAERRAGYGLDAGRAHAAGGSAAAEQAAARAEATRQRLAEAAAAQEAAAAKAARAAPREAYRTGKLSAEEKAARLAAMMGNADAHEAARRERLDKVCWGMEHACLASRRPIDTASPVVLPGGMPCLFSHHHTGVLQTDNPTVQLASGI